MHSKLTACFGFAFLAALTAGCAVESSPADDPQADEAAASQDELSSAASKLVGTWEGQGTVRPPSFQKLELTKRGTFSADIDTGIRCITTPCPSFVHLEGTFTATKSYLRLRPRASDRSQQYAGYYRYTLKGDALSLSRSDWNGWTESFDRQDTRDVFPEDATKLVAESPGGGFTPPPPPGSTCAIGRQKYSLDLASRKLDWEQCEFTGTSQPLHLKTGSRTLTLAELASVTAAANDLKISTRDICGADKPMLKVAVTTPSGTQTYTDSFYSCMGQGPFVDDIDAVFSAFRNVAK
jgi:hypothetical protein